ncbi:MAG: RNA polymerase sigma factor [Thermoleophilia bacterium]
MTLDPHPPPAPSDADLIRRSLVEPIAFEAVFERHFDAVHAFAQRRVGRDLADEVAAEAFVRAFDRRSRYDGSHVDALPWLLGIATNVMRRHWRGERRRLDAYARSVAGPASAAPGGEAAGELLAAVARLPRAQREVLLLHAWADLSYEEIARALEVPIGTVRSRLARARARLSSDACALAPTLPCEEASRV